MSTANATTGDLQKILEGPDDAALDAGQRALLDTARNAFTELGKLVKNIQLYGDDHQANERFRTRFIEATQALVAEHPEVQIRVSAYELLLFDRTLYENESPERNFIYKFFMDGVRSLIFQAGVSAEELNGLVDILLIDWSDPSLFEDDVVTLMWNKEFQCIGYTVAADYGDDAKEGEKHHYTIAGVLENVRRLADTEVGAASDGDRRARLKADRLNEAVGLSAADLEQFEEHPFAMDEEEFQRLKAVLHTTSRETLEKFIEILFRVNMDDVAADREERVVNIFERIADLQLRSGNIGELERLMRKVRKLGIDTSSGDGQAAIQRIFARWSRPEFVNQVGAALSDMKSPYTPSVLAIFTLLDTSAVAAICQLAGRVRIGERRQQLVALLPTLIRTPEQGMAVARLLDQADQGLAHDILRVLRGFNDDRVTDSAMRHGFANADPAVRLECLSALPPAGAAKHRELLFEALADASKPVRSKAIHTLARIREPDVFDRIMAQIDAKAFSGYSLDEKRRYCVAAALAGDPTARFLDLLGGGRLIGRSRSQEELRHCAAVALAVRMCADAVPLFKKELGKRLRSETVAEACAWGLVHLQCSREVRTEQLYDIFYRGVLSGVGHG